MIRLDSSLTRRQGVVLAGRVLCVFFLYWSLLNLSEIPLYVSTLIHNLHPGEGLIGARSSSYITELYVSFVCGAILRAAVEFWIAGMFYRCGPKIAEFLLPPETEMVASAGDEA